MRPACVCLRKRLIALITVNIDNAKKTSAHYYTVSRVAIDLVGNRAAMRTTSQAKLTTIHWNGLLYP